MSELPHPFVQAIIDTCMKFNCIIGICPFNKYALESLRCGAVCKPYTVTRKTEIEGPYKGYVLDENLNYLLDEKGRKVTSDLDLCFILQTTKEIASFDKDYGYIGKNERRIIDYLNTLIASSLCLDSDIRVVTHGPLNNLPNQTFGFEKMPITIIDNHNGPILFNSNEDILAYILASKYQTNLTHIIKAL